MSPSSPDDRTRRNVACVNCRNSKVRCRSSPLPGQACQRCAKLDIACVVDKFHKRVTKRSKLERLEQELESIKQVVQPASAAWTPPSPRPAITAIADTRPVSINDATTSTSQAPTPQDSSRSQTSAQPSSERRLNAGPTEARILGNHIVSGEDIDWYFAKYLQHYHRFAPVLRKRDPDDCYRANSTLFWLVVSVACRRYARDRSLLTILTDHLEKDIWKMISATALDLEAVHALLIMCSWPMPNIRFMTDPSTTLANVAMTTALSLGCHTGQGNHRQFLVGLRQHFQATDEEASSTWLACCMLAQRMSAAMGIPPPSIQHNYTRAKAALQSSAWAELLMVHDVQCFLNRYDNAICGHVSAHGGVHESEIAMWETEFESLKPLFGRHGSDLSRFILLAAQLEVQSGYFMFPPDAPPSPSIKSHAVRVFNTARSIITHSLDFDSRAGFLTHCTQWVIRTNVDAACIIIAILHSDCSPGMTEPDAQLLVQKACGAVLRASIRDADLAHRASIIMETFWAIRNLVPSFGACPSSRIDRTAAGVTFWCLNKFRKALQDAQNSTDRVNNALELMRRNAPTSQSQNATVDTATDGKGQSGTLVTDSSQEVDWAMFMDDFGWASNDTVLLGLP